MLEKIFRSFTYSWQSFLLIVLSSFFLSTTAFAATTINCDVAIVGGGPGGTLSAYKLTTLNKSSNVCLFEKNDHLGGRAGNNFPIGKGGGYTGGGAYRMYQNHYTYQLGLELNKLAPSLGIDVSQQDTIKPSQIQVSFTRLNGVEKPTGGFPNSSFNSQNSYFTYTTNPNDSGKQLGQLYNSPIDDNGVWHALLCGPWVPRDANKHPLYNSPQMKANVPGIQNMSTSDYLDFVGSHYAPATAQYFKDVWRFRADYKGGGPSQLPDAISYLDWNAIDFVGGANFYAIPSYKQWFDVMEAAINQSGKGTIYFQEQVTSINESPSGQLTLVTKDAATLTTVIHNVNANSVIIATDHTSLGQIGGNIVSTITARPEYQNIANIKAITVSHQWGDSSGNELPSGQAWWKTGNTAYPAGPKLLLPKKFTLGNPIRRATTNIKVNGYSINTSELALSPWNDSINVARSLYSDDPDQVALWVALYNSPGGINAVNTQIRQNLRLIFPNVFTGTLANEPKIINSAFTYHNPAWYFLKKGANSQGLTNASVFAYSQNPLASTSFPNKKVFLVGDVWNNNSSGWTDGAFKSALQVLNTHYGTNINPKFETPIICTDDNKFGDPG